MCVGGEISWQRFKTRWLAKLAESQLRKGKAVNPQVIPRAAINAFHIAASQSDAYRTWLEKQGVNPLQIQKPEDFRHHVPLMSKQDIFPGRTLSELWKGHLPGELAGVYTSSGYSGQFAWSFETQSQRHRAAGDMDILLQLFFGIADRSTLLINALPAGVRVPTNLCTVLESGPRPDTVAAALLQLAPAYQQVLLMGEQPVLKAIVEAADATKVDWSKFGLHVVTGAELLAENYRRYLGTMIRPWPEKDQPGGLLVSMGISELGLSIGQGSPGCRKLRQALHEDKKLCQAVLGDVPFVPGIVQYLPGRHYLETPVIDGKPRLVVTTLEKGRVLPLVRYATGDWAQVWGYEQLKQKLQEVGREDLCPKYSLPVLMMFGRGKFIPIGTREIYAEQVKEGLYEQPAIVRQLTGNFHLRENGGLLVVEVQATQKGSLTKTQHQELETILAQWTGVAVQVVVRTCQEFPGGTDIIYHRKWRYID